MTSTFLTLLDYDDPVVEVRSGQDLPSMRIGETIELAFTLERTHAGRRELLKVNGLYRVSEAHLSMGPLRQRLGVEAVGVAPSWVAVKNHPPRKLGPTIFPKTSI